MRENPSLKTVSDAELLRSLSEVLKQSRRVEANLVAHIAEVDKRRLYAREAAPSMHAYCIDVLHLSEPETALRIHVARASRSHPVLLEMLRAGRIHLSGIALLAPHLTAQNRRSLLKRATPQDPAPDRGDRRRAEASSGRPGGDAQAAGATGSHRDDGRSSSGQCGAGQLTE